MSEEVYVLIAIDDDYRVRECVVVRDLETAQRLYSTLRQIWDGDKVCMASRMVDDLPDNLMRALSREARMPPEVEALIGAANPIT